MLIRVQAEGGDQLCSLSEFEEMVRQGTIRPYTRIHCPPQTGEGFVEARQTELYRSIQDAPDMRLRRAWAVRTIPWMTALIVGLEFRIFFWTHLTPLEGGLIDRLARWTPGIVEGGQSWRLFTYGLLHGSVSHVVMNMLFIGYAGVALENMFGPVNLLLLFVVGVVSGGALSSVFMLDSRSIGASAGDFGLMGACVVFGWRYLEIIPPRARPAFGALILAFTIYVLLGSFGSEGVDYWGHLGGLIGGAAVAPILMPRALPGAEARNRAVQAVCGGLLVALFGGLWAFGPTLAPWTPLEADGARAARPLLWKAGWSELGHSAWRSPVEDLSLSLSTEKFDEAVDAAAEQRSLLNRALALDPQAQLTFSGDEARAGQVGRRVRLSWSDPEPRAVDAWILVRGRYVHSLIAEAPNPEEAAARLDRALDALEIRDPEEVAAGLLQVRGRTWRDLLKLAEAAQALGRQQEARALLEEAMAAAPEEEDPALEWLAVLRDPPIPAADRPAATAKIAAVLAAWPEGRRMRAEAARTLVAIGEPAQARALLTEGLGRWPGDRRLGRAWKELFAPDPEPGQPSGEGSAGQPPKE